MRFTRPSRVIAAFVALISMLFMQLAVAGYACPTLERGTTHEIREAAMEMASDSLTPCQGMDQEQPSLCHASEQAGKLSLDKPHSPPAAVFVPTALIATLHPSGLPNLSSSQWQEPFSLARSTAPPLSIQNCCFRI
ncbi:hypothetical protein [Noviherbaspirillum suwonense]|uniref:hypothetical protein n=1 Tax=Noviherbaspirillum suwonense TaxID=1224511 RepID=UPI0024B6F8D8|nr:hypothetical protein [Noviherbaspirillum suwonense]